MYLFTKRAGAFNLGTLRKFPQESLRGRRSCGNHHLGIGTAWLGASQFLAAILLSSIISVFRLAVSPRRSMGGAPQRGPIPAFSPDRLAVGGVPLLEVFGLGGQLLYAAFSRCNFLLYSSEPSARYQDPLPLGVVIA